MNHAIEMPPLVGTPAQVSWAERIRLDAAPVIARWAAESERADASFCNWALQHNSAKFWIDVRSVQSKAEFLARARAEFQKVQAALPPPPSAKYLRAFHRRQDRYGRA